MNYTTLVQAVGRDDMAQDIVTAISEGLMESAVQPERDPYDLIEAAVAAVTMDVQSHPTVGILTRFILADEELTDEEVRRALEFVFAHMTSKFQGYLAEFLAMGVGADAVRQWKQGGILPPDLKILWGLDLRQQTQTRRGSWVLGADGLLICEHGDDLVVAAAIEVKSHRRRATRQIARHVERLRYGLRVGGFDWPAEKIHVGTFALETQEWATIPVMDQGVPELPCLIIRPRLARREELSPLFRPTILSTTLPYRREILAEAAFAMTTWFLARLGEVAFRETGSPWPDMTHQQAGMNAVKEGLFYVLLRPLSLRGDWIATRLYNIFGFGYEAAQDRREMMWPDPPEPGE